MNKTNISKRTCSACGEGTLSPFTDSEEFLYKEKRFTLDNIEYSRCSSCGMELLTSEQQQRLDNRVRDEHRKIDGLLTSSEIRDIRKKLGLTQSDAAELFGGGANSFSKYERSEVIQNISMDRLLRVVDKIPSIVNELREMVGQKVVDHKFVPQTAYITNTVIYPKVFNDSTTSSDYELSEHPFYKQRYIN